MECPYILVNIKGAEDSPNRRTQNWKYLKEPAPKAQAKVRNFRCAGKISMWWYPDLRSNLNKWKPWSKIWMATLKSSHLNFCLKMKLFTCLRSSINLCLPELRVETESGLTMWGTQKISSTRLPWSSSLTASDSNDLLESAVALFALNKGVGSVVDKRWRLPREY